MVAASGAVVSSAFRGSVERSTKQRTRALLIAYHSMISNGPHNRVALMQNRATAFSADPSVQQVLNAYQNYSMLTAAAGQNITLTWPRTAAPDGLVPDGSDSVNIYFNPDSSINAGKCITIARHSNTSRSKVSNTKL